MTQPGIETWSPGPLANILLIMQNNLQFDLFQTQTTAYQLLTKNYPQIRISKQGKENSKKFPIFWYFWKFFCF